MKGLYGVDFGYNGTVFCRYAPNIKPASRKKPTLYQNLTQHGKFVLLNFAGVQKHMNYWSSADNRKPIGYFV